MFHVCHYFLGIKTTPPQKKKRQKKKKKKSSKERNETRLAFRLPLLFLVCQYFWGIKKINQNTVRSKGQTFILFGTIYTCMNLRVQTEKLWSKLQKLNEQKCTKKSEENTKRNCAQIHNEAVHKCTKRLNQQWSVAAEVGNPPAVLAQPAPGRRNNLSHLFLSILYNSLLLDWRNIYRAS